MKRNKDGNWPVRVRFGKKRKKRLVLPARFSGPEAAARLAQLEKLAGKCHHLPHDKALDLLTEAASVEASELPDLMALASERGTQAKQRAKPGKSITFKDAAEMWLSGEMRRQFPDYVGEKDMAGDRTCLERHYPVIGSVPLHLFCKDDAHRAMRALPEGLADNTRRHYRHVIFRVLKLAAYPCELIDVNPLPSGFVGPQRSGREKSFIYPAEDALVLQGPIPQHRKLLWGALPRTGLRLGEALGLQKRHMDLVNGTLRVDKLHANKPSRTFVVEPDVLRTFRVLLADKRNDAPLFENPRGQNAANQFRDDLLASGVDRPELFENSDVRQPVRAHDLRATFVVLNKAAGRTDTWIMDRTGHLTSNMLQAYDRPSRRVAEMVLGPLGPLDRLLGLAQDVAQALHVVGE